MVGSEWQLIAVWCVLNECLMSGVISIVHQIYVCKVRQQSSNGWANEKQNTKRNRKKT